MKATLNHLPIEKRDAVLKIADIVKKAADIEMIILYGSFARGDWVSDIYKEGHIVYEYLSDFDVLILVKNKKLAENYTLWNQVEHEIKNHPEIKMPVSLVIDTVDFMNKRLKEGNYFYVDVFNEGILLYDSKRYTLSLPGVLPVQEKKRLAKQDFGFWYGKAQSFLKDYYHNISDTELNNAAFHLHQIAESLLVCVLLVFTGYKPKTHNLEKILNMVVDLNDAFADVFERTTPEQKRLFELLKKAYVDARYKQDFIVKKEELEALFKSVQKLEDLVKKTCEEKIAGIK